MPENKSSAPSSRRWDKKDRVIALLALTVLMLLALVVWDRAGASGWFAGFSGEKVAVFDVVLDRENLSYVDILFDKPLGEGKEGGVLAEPPATISPVVGGVWKWRDASALRFEPSGRLAMATEYTLSLILDRLLKKGQRFVGDDDLKLVTDQFLVSGVTVAEEPAPEAGAGAVVLRGEVRFNYSVDPEALGVHLKLVDGGTPVPVMLETTWSSDAIGFRTGAVVKKPAERALKLSIAQSLTPADGNVALAEDFRQDVVLGSSEKLAVRGATSQPGERESQLRVTFSSPVSAEVATRYLTVEPNVSFRVAADGNDAILVGAFVPGVSYKVAAGAGLPATDGAVLEAGWSAELRLANLTPSVRFVGEGSFLSASGAHRLAIETVNVAKVDLTLERVYRNNLFSLFQYQSYLLYGSSYRGSSVNVSLGDQLHQETLTIKAEPNRKVVTPIALDRHIKDHEPGFYRVAVSADGSYEAEQRWVLITDLGLVAKWGQGEFVVWVNSFADLSAQGGVRVKLISEQNQLLAEGTTGGDGLVRLGGERLKEGSPYLLLAERGDDLSFLLLSQSAVDVTGLDVGGSAAERPAYDAFLYGQRDLYRPGEVVEGLGVLRDRALKAPPVMPVVLVHRAPDGQELESQSLKSDAAGLVPYRFELEPYATTGDHTLEMKAGEQVVGNYRFQVEEFVPDRIKVEIAPTAPSLVGSGDLQYQVSSAYLFGPPASGLAVDSRVRLVAAPFAAKGFEAFSFENSERSFEEVQILAQEGELDDGGKKSFRAVVPPGLTPPAALLAVVTARAQEKGGRGVTAMTRVPVFPYPRYVGIRKLEDAYADPGKPTSFEWVSVAPDGKPAPSGALRVELYHDRWNTLLRRGDDGVFRYESVRDPRLVETQAVLAGQSRGTVSLTPKTYGAYRAVVVDLSGGASSQVEFYASGWGFSPWALKSPGRVELDLDRESYSPGSTATVQVRAPFPGKLLLTIEREGVLRSETHLLTGNTASIPLTVEGSWRPNVYVTATLLRSAKDLSPGEAGRAFGAVPLAVDRAEKQLPLIVTAPQEMRPETALEVRVATAPGAAVTVAAVDEGILRLVDQQTPDPFAYFYRKLALGVRSFDIFALLLPERFTSPAGGGEGLARMAQFMSTASMLRLEPAAYWSGVVTAGSDGVAKARFEVGEFQGTLRVMVVGVEGDRFGSTERGVVVRDRVVALPTLPRFLQVGDGLDVPVSVRNDTGKDGEFEVTMAWQLPGSEPASVKRSVRVAEASEAVVYLPLVAGKTAGVAAVTLTAEGNGERTRSRAKLPVRHALPARRSGSTGSLTKAKTSFEVSRDYEPGTVSQEVTLGPVPVISLKGRLADLVDYPYGCLEQTTSRVFPLIHLADLARELEPKLFEAQDPGALVEQGLRRVGSMQLATGAFTMWPDGSDPQPWASVYATHMLVEAKAAGHYVEYDLLENALSYIAGLASAKASYGADELERVSYALYVLARADKADRGSMDFLAERHLKAMTASSRGLLAAAYAAVGAPERVAPLLAGLSDVEKVERQSGGNFSSTLRNRALLLLALADAAPGDARIPDLAERLAREAESGEYWTTQENAFAFLALGKLFAEAAEKPAVNVTVRQGGKEVGRYDGKTLTWGPFAGSEVSLEAGSAPAPGAVYYAVTTRGILKESAFRAESRGLEIERSFLTREGEEASLDDVEQGDLLVVKTRVRSTSGPVENVVLSILLPPGLEVENPRLKTTETLPWVTDANLDPEELDLRDDRVLAFTALPANQWMTIYTVLRAVVPGTYRLPPAQVEAMYNPSLAATGEAGEIRVKVRE